MVPNGTEIRSAVTRIESVHGTTFDERRQKSQVGTLSRERVETTNSIVGQTGNESRMRKNLVLVVVDAWRADALAASGEMGETPFLDRFATSNTRFTQAVATSSHTKDSFPGIFASTLPSVQGQHHISPETATLAEVLAKQGYETLGVHSTPHFSVDTFNYDAGFDTFRDICAQPSGTSSLKKVRAPAKPLLRRLPPKILSAMEQIYQRSGLFADIGDVNEYTASATETTDAAIELLSGVDTDDPFVLFVHYMDVHSPYLPPETHLPDGITAEQARRLNDRLLDHRSSLTGKPSTITEDELRDLKALYRATTRYTDEQIERLVSRLDETAGLEKTVVVVTGDHGEEFREHGDFLHGQKLYEELLRVPLVIGGGEVPARRIRSQMSLLDLPPTLLDLLGVKSPDSFRGRSFAPAVRGERTVEREFALAETTAKRMGVDVRHLVSCRTAEGKKLIRGDTEEFYDLSEDPSESTNRIHDIDNERVEPLRRRVRTLIEKGQLKPGSVGDETIQKRLEHLGYRR